MVNLYDVLRLLNYDEDMPDALLERDPESYLPYNHTNIKLCFMSEEETWISTYSGHPILILLYSYPVTKISPIKDNEIEIWMDVDLWYREYTANLLKGG